MDQPSRGREGGVPARTGVGIGRNSLPGSATERADRRALRCRVPGQRPSAGGPGGGGGLWGAGGGPRPRPAGGGGGGSCASDGAPPAAIRNRLGRLSASSRPASVAVQTTRRLARVIAVYAKPICFFHPRT